MNDLSQRCNGKYLSHVEVFRRRCRSCGSSPRCRNIFYLDSSRTRDSILIGFLHDFQRSRELRNLFERTSNGNPHTSCIDFFVKKKKNFASDGIMLVVGQTAMRIAENNEMCLKLAQENGPVPPVPPATSTKEQEGEKTTPADFCCGDKAQVFTVDAVDVSLDGG